jgi:hypothetical protein
MSEAFAKKKEKRYEEKTNKIKIIINTYLREIKTL